MQTITINVLGFEPTKAVPSTVEEYNALAPSRSNPVLEDAIDTTIYRGTSPVIREKLCEYIENSLDIARRNSGTDEAPVWEKESVFVKRAIAELMQKTGQTEAQVRATIAPAVQSAADAAPFPVATKERTSDGPAIGKRDLANAAQMQKDGKADAVAAKLSTILARTIDGADVKNLARGLADYRRQIAAQAEAQLAS